MKPAAAMSTMGDALDQLAPLLRVRPELQEFCRFGGSWRAPQPPAEKGWAAFHIVTKGRCLIEYRNAVPIALEAGDVLLLPHGDDHLVFGGAGASGASGWTVTDRDYIRVKETKGAAIETELICGRLHLESTDENLLLRTLPRVITLGLGGMPRYRHLIEMIRDELQEDRHGAATVTRDLSSALFVMFLRDHLQECPPTQGLLALLTARETRRAVAAMIDDPARRWKLDELASLAALSRATLVRAFRRIGGLAPETFLTELRLGLAKDRITNTTETLATIAADAGYESEASLSRAINRRFAVRPVDMRRQRKDKAASPA